MFFNQQSTCLLHRLQEAFEQAEKESHHIAYQLQKLHLDGMHIHYDDEHGKMTRYAVHAVATQHPGIVAHILVPVEKRPVIKILFQGTKNAASYLRDFQTSPAGAGSTSLLAESESILKQIAQHVDLQHARCNTNIHVHFAGHSLGGADAQNMYAELLHHKAHLGTFQHVDAVSVAHKNSAGIPETSARKADNAAQILNSESTRTQTQLAVYALRVKGDSIQNDGDTMLHTNIDPTLAKSHMLVIDNGYKITASAHRGKFFGTIRCDLIPSSTFLYASNEASDHAINQPLDNWVVVHKDDGITGAMTLNAELNNKSYLLRAHPGIPVRILLQGIVISCQATVQSATISRQALSHIYSRIPSLGISSFFTRAPNTPTETNMQDIPIEEIETPNSVGLNTY